MMKPFLLCRFSSFAIRRRMAASSGNDLPADNHAVRSERWRYIRYADEDEELYDHARDSLERTNLAAHAEHAHVLADLKRWLPKSEAKPGSDLMAKRPKSK